MASTSVSVRLDEGLVAWVDDYAKERGSKRSRVIEAAVESFRGLAAGGVPDLESASSGKGVGQADAPGVPQGRPLPVSAPSRVPKPRVRPNVPGVVTAREILMRQRQERVNRGGS